MALIIALLRLIHLKSTAIATAWEMTVTAVPKAPAMWMLIPMGFPMPVIAVQRTPPILA